MIKTIPNGVYPTMITPFTDDNRVDYNAVEKLIEWYVNKKVDGIFAICQSSEIFFLSFEERLELLKFIVKNTPSNISVVASGHTADDSETQIKEAKAFIEQGIDAYVFISNRFANADENDDIFLKNAEKVASQIGDIGLGVYECPYPYRRLLCPETLKKLTTVGDFLFLKDTCCDIKTIAAKLKAVEKTGMKIFNANAATLYETLKLGCSGYSGVMANFHPEIYSWLCKNYKEKPETAMLVSDFVGFFSVIELQLYPVNAKYHLMLEGIPMTYNTRSKNIAEFTENKKLEIEQMHRLAAQIKNALLPLSLD